MSTTVSVAGSSYSVPQEGDSGWASDVTNLLIQLATSTKVLQVTSSSFPLTQDLSFGTSYGLKVQYLKSQASNPASAGAIRLGNTESVKWRNAANNADLDLTVNASDVLQFNGSSVLMPGIGSIVNADISNSAAIAYSKLNLTGNIVNTDISNSAAIAYSKLNLSTSIVNADISASAAIAYSKLNLSGSILNDDINASAAISYSKLSLSNSIVNADISSSAAIALSKLAALTTGKALQSNASTGVIEASSVTNTELSRLSGIGSSAVGISDAQVLTNKDIDGGTASNSRRLTLPKDTLTNLTSLTRKQGTLVFDTTSNKPYYDDGSNLRVIGSGSGSGGNLIDDGDAEAGTSNYVEGSYSAATRPSGTFTSSSGVGSFTISTTSSSPLSGNNSFVLTKSSGASRQGRAVERTINLDLENRAKVLEVKIKYIVSSGSFVAGSSSSDSSLIWYIGQYNGSTWTYTEPSSFKMFSSSTSISDVLIGNFQTNYDTTQVKLIAYVAESANSAWAVKCEVAIQPCNYIYGTPITDWQSYTATVAGFGTISSSNFEWRRVGDSVQVKGRFTSGTSTATAATISLPNGVIVDTIKVPNQEELGEWHTNSTATSGFLFVSPGGNTMNMSIGTGLNNSNGNAIAASGGVVVFSSFSIPIAGWSSSVQMSNNTDTRVISAFYNGQPTGTLAGSDNLITIPTKVIDTAASMSSGTYTVPVSGKYSVTAQVGLNTTSATANQYFTLSIKQNGTLRAENVIRAEASSIDSRDAQVHAELDCSAGDTITLTSNTNMTSVTYNSTVARSYVKIERLSGPATIAATESINVKATTSSTAITTVATTAVVFSSVAFDTHNLYSTSTGKYTIPVSGKYEISGAVYSNNGGTNGVSTEFRLIANQSGSVSTSSIVNRQVVQTTSLIGVGMNGSTIFNCLAGDQIWFTVFNGGSSTITLNNAAADNFICITRVGN